MERQLNQTKLIKRFRMIEMNRQDFLKGAKKSSLFKKIGRRKKEDKRTILSVRDVKGDDDWNILAHQVMGEEIY